MNIVYLYATFMAKLMLAKKNRKKQILAISSEYDKVKKKNTAKIKFTKKWFIANYDVIYETNKSVFEEMNISGSADYVFGQFLNVKSGSLDLELFNFINQIYTDQIMPRQLVELD